MDVVQILRTVETPDVVLSSIAMSHSGRMLFTGTSAGSVRSMKFPLTVPGEWTDYHAHSSPVVKVCCGRGFTSLLTFSLLFVRLTNDYASSLCNTGPSSGILVWGITTADSMSMWIPFPSWAARIEWSHSFYSSPIQPQHMLHWLLPPLKESGHNLRSRGHSLFCSVLQRSLIWGLATPLTYFLHLSLSSVILIDSSRGSPVHVLMLSICAMCGLLCLRAPGIVPRIISSSFSSVVDRHTKCMWQPRSCL